jgi:hypothetical protein
MKCSKCGIDKDELLDEINRLDAMLKLQGQEMLTSLEETIAILDKRHKK